MLANPGLQKRFRMIAYDLPYRGKSFPPEGEEWWLKRYTPSMHWLISWPVALSDALSLTQPFFLGCSVGGQMALDLAAEHGFRFGAFFSLHGWYDASDVLKTFDDNLFRTPSISDTLVSANMLGTSGPLTPESGVHEVE
ncbi:hypothetical protein KCV07_g9908, partial [Aureobasidium melanogenum]